MVTALTPPNRATGEEIAAAARDAFVRRSLAEREGRMHSAYMLVREDELQTLLAWAEYGLAAAAGRTSS